MATYVLVHGAWSGAHTWRKVRPLLREAGHEVFTPCLTGIGERVHLARPDVNLSTHIEDMLNVFHFEDLSEVVLLGYSYGGMVVTGVADRIPERIAHLVYLDAFLPEDGQAVYGTGGNQAAADSEDWLVPPPPRQYDDPAEAEWSNARRVPHPRGCFTEPVRLSMPLEHRPFSLTYIKATGEPRPEGSRGGFWDAADRVLANPRWRYREIATNHMVASNRPAELTSLLLEVIALEQV
jgi:pimeloyl-ACP methyl ester carboxylesterase